MTKILSSDKVSKQYVLNRYKGEPLSHSYPPHLLIHLPLNNLTITLLGSEMLGLYCKQRLFDIVALYLPAGRQDWVLC